MQDVRIYDLSCGLCGAPATYIVVIEGIKCGDGFCENCAKKMRDEIEEGNQRQRDEGLLPEWFDT